MTTVRKLDPELMRQLARRLEDKAGELRYQHARISSSLWSANRSNWSVRRLLLVANEQEDFAEQLRARAANAEGWNSFDTQLLDTPPPSPQRVANYHGSRNHVSQRRFDWILFTIQEAARESDNGGLNGYRTGDVVELADAIKRMDSEQLVELIGYLSEEEADLLLREDMYYNLFDWTYESNPSLETVLNDHRVAQQELSDLLFGTDLPIALAASLKFGDFPEPNWVALIESASDDEVRAFVSTLLKDIPNDPRLAEVLATLLSENDVAGLARAISVPEDGEAIALLLEASLELDEDAQLNVLMQVFAALDVHANDEKANSEYLLMAADLYEQLGARAILDITNDLFYYTGADNHDELWLITDRMGSDLGMLSRLTEYSDIAMSVSDLGLGAGDGPRAVILLANQGRFSSAFLETLLPFYGWWHSMSGPIWPDTPPHQAFLNGDVQVQILQAFANNPQASQQLLATPAPDGGSMLEWLADANPADGGAALGTILGFAATSDHDVVVDQFHSLVYGDLDHLDESFWIAAMPFVSRYLPDLSAAETRPQEHLKGDENRSGFVPISSSEVTILIEKLMASGEEAATRFVEEVVAFLPSQHEDIIGSHSAPLADFVGTVFAVYTNTLADNGRSRDEANALAASVVIGALMTGISTVAPGSPILLKPATIILSAALKERFATNVEASMEERGDALFTDFIWDFRQSLFVVLYSSGALDADSWTADTPLPAELTNLELPEDQAIEEWLADNVAVLHAYQDWYADEGHKAINDAIGGFLQDVAISYNMDN